MLFAGDRVVVLRRDDKPGLVWRGRLDFPGGGREGRETPEACVLRETREEVGLALDPAALRFVQLRHSRAGVGWFFAAHLSADVLNDIQLGDEGKEWLAMTPDDYIKALDNIPPFAMVLRTYLGQ